MSNTRNSDVKYVEIEKFNSLDFTDTSGGTHSVTKVAQGDKVFFKKEIEESDANRNDDDKEIAIAIETTAGQIYHLLMPYQPETLLAQNTEKTARYILSQEIPGYKSLASVALSDRSGLQKALNEGGDYKGLGSVMTASYFANEIDSKLMNLGVAQVNGVNTIIKIDGDWSLANVRGTPELDELMPSHTHKITPAGIAQMPLMSDYKTLELLDFMRGGMANIAYADDNSPRRLISPTLSDSASFRQEVNEMMLKTLLLPSTLINEITRNNTSDPDIANKIITELTERQQQMLNAAVQNESFKAYMNTSAAKECLQTTTNDFNNFKEKYHLACPDVTSMLQNSFQTVQNQLQPEMLEKRERLAELETKIEQAMNARHTVGDQVNPAEIREVVKNLTSLHEDLKTAGNLSRELGDTAKESRLTGQAQQIGKDLDQVKSSYLSELQTKLEDKKSKEYGPGSTLQDKKPKEDEPQIDTTRMNKP